MLTTLNWSSLEDLLNQPFLKLVSYSDTLRLFRGKPAAVFDWQIATLLAWLFR